MYITRLRNFAVSLGGDPQDFLYDTLEEAVYAAILTVSGGANRIGSVVDHVPHMTVQPEDVLLSFWSGNGESVRFTDYRELDIERRFGILNYDFAWEAARLASVK